MNSNLVGSSDLFVQIVFNNSDNLVLAPIRATYNCPRGKYTVIRNVCSNGAFGIVVRGAILFCGEIPSGLVFDRDNVCIVDLDKSIDAENNIDLHEYLMICAVELAV